MGVCGIASSGHAGAFAPGHNVLINLPADCAPNGRIGNAKAPTACAPNGRSGNAKAPTTMQKRILRRGECLRLGGLRLWFRIG